MEELKKWYMRGHIQESKAWPNQAALYRASDVDEREKEYKAEMGRLKKASFYLAEVERADKAVTEAKGWKAQIKAADSILETYDFGKFGLLHDRVFRVTRYLEEEIERLKKIESDFALMFDESNRQKTRAIKAEAEVERLNQAIEEGNRQEGWQKAEIERLKESMAKHFHTEHLSGDGPEIDRWKAKAKSLRAHFDFMMGRKIAAKADLKIAVGALEKIKQWCVKHAKKMKGWRVYDVTSIIQQAFADIEKPDETRFTVPLTGERIHERTPFSDKANEKLGGFPVPDDCKEELALALVTAMNRRLNRAEDAIESVQAEIIRMKQ